MIDSIWLQSNCEPYFINTDKFVDTYKYILLECYDLDKEIMNLIT